MYSLSLRHSVCTEVVKMMVVGCMECHPAMVEVLSRRRSLAEKIPQYGRDSTFKKTRDNARLKESLEN